MKFREKDLISCEFLIDVTFLQSLFENILLKYLIKVPLNKSKMCYCIYFKNYRRWVSFNKRSKCAKTFKDENFIKYNKNF